MPNFPGYEQLYTLFSCTISRLLHQIFESYTNQVSIRIKMARPILKIKVVTFSVHYPLNSHLTGLELVDCSDLEPPPAYLCNRFTGLQREISDHFFSIPEHVDILEDVYSDLKEKIRDWSRDTDGHTLLVPVACRAGLHRSVAMAERIAKKISNWHSSRYELRVHVEHRRLWRTIEAQSRDSDAGWKRFCDLRNIVEPMDDGIIRREYDHGRVHNLE